MARKRVSIEGGNVLRTRASGKVGRCENANCGETEKLYKLGRFWLCASCRTRIENAMKPRIKDPLEQEQIREAIRNDSKKKTGRW